MLHVKRCSVVLFLTLITFVSSTSGNCTNHFVFSNLNDSQRIISYSNENISVEFRVNWTCSTPFNGSYNVFDKTKSLCTFHHKNGKCRDYANTKYCHCPKEGSDLYRVEIPAGERHSNTWTWSSSLNLVKEHKIHIVILLPDSTPTEGLTSNTTAAVNSTTPVTLQKATDSNTTGATVAACITIITAVIVTIALIVVYRHKTKAVGKRQPKVIVRDLYRGSNVSMMINNDLYDGLPNAHHNLGLAHVNTSQNPVQRSSVTERRASPPPSRGQQMVIAAMKKIHQETPRDEVHLERKTSPLLDQRQQIVTAAMKKIHQEPSRDEVHLEQNASPLPSHGPWMVSAAMKNISPGGSIDHMHLDDASSDADYAPGGSESDYSPVGSESDYSHCGSESDYLPSCSESDSEDESDDDYEDQVGPGVAGERGSKLVSDRDPDDDQVVQPETDESDSDCDSVVYSALVTPCKQDKSRADPLHVAEKAPQENKWGKKHSCKFCSKMVVKMSTHLTKVHAHEAEVAAVLRLPKGSKERRNGFVRLLNEGDYKHNYDVLEGQSGTVIPKYRKAGRQAGQLLACRFCQGLYVKSLLSKHLHNCPQNPDPSKPLKWGECSKVGSYMLLIGKEKNSAFFQAVVGRMRDDAVKRVIENDSLIIKFGSRLFYKKDVEEHTRGNISSRLRELGRLVLELKAKSEMKVASLKQALDPIHFDLVIETVRAMAHFEEPSHAYKKGNLALKLGYSLKTCCKILVSEAIKSSDKLLLEKVQNFSSLLASDWHDSVSAGAAQSVAMAKMNKQLLLPSLKDVEKVNGLINEDMQSTEYSVLAKATLASLTIFNRKRGGELQRMKVQDFQVLQSSSIEEEMLKTLTTTEQKLVKILQRVEIKGKFTRPVPILLTPSMVHAVERLLKMRAEKDITSPYLFASSGEKPFRGSDVLRTYAQKAQVDSESLFTATNLRKQLATLSQAMELSKLEEDQLAGFLGHDIRIHRGVYRKPIQIVQKAKVASVLFKLNRGVDIPEEIDEKSLEEEILPADEENEDEEPAAAASAEVSQEERPPSCSLSNENTAGACASVGDVSLTIAPATSTSAKGGKTLTQKRRPDGTKTQKKMPWKKEEIAAVEKHLAACFSMNKVPQKFEAERCKQAESSVLKHRSWKDIKYCVYNRLKQIRSK